LVKKTLNQCDICGSTDVAHISNEIYESKNYAVMLCRKCSFVFVNDIYEDISPDYRKKIVDDALIWLQGEHKIQAFQQSIKIINRYFKKISPTILDVGCATGGWLKYVSKNKLTASTNLYGFDASINQVEYAQSSFPHVKLAVDIDDYVGKLNDISAQFDLITLWDVLEHIRQPSKFMVSVAQRLSVGGLIYISVPNALPMRIKAKLNFYGSTWSPNEHINYFNPRTLQIICEKVGLKILSIGSVKVYRRSLSIFEVIRRCYFFTAYRFPRISPQVYILAQRSVS
jgi:2-polyprenyl-3-methyl-5-hydroxy-6-metoxy-1,4-benzoquinol methylase